MKRLIFSFASLLAFHLSIAQMPENGVIRYGNEWIDYDNSYLKIPVGEDGIYRLTFEQMQALEVPVESMEGRQFQLFHHGQEVPLYTSSEGQLGIGDFLEFYGKKNRAELDRYLFNHPEQEMLNPEYSLVNDTAAYFLTWTSASIPKKRYSAIPNNLSAPPLKETWFWHETLLNYTKTLAKYESASLVKKSHFQPGEGFSNGFLKTNKVTVKPAQVYPLADSARLLLRFATNDRQHELDLLVNGQLRYSSNYFGYRLHQHDLGVILEGNTPSVDIEINGKNSNNDRQALANIVLKYPHSYNFENKATFNFSLPNENRPVYLEIENFKTSNAPVILYDLTHHLRIEGKVEQGLVKVVLPAVANNGKNRDLILVSYGSGVLGTVNIKPVIFTDYRINNANYVIISSPAINKGSNGRDLVQEYAAYRSSLAGGSFNPVVVDIQQLYDQFAYGVDRHFIAIRNFGHYIQQNWPNVQYFFILGKGLECNQIRTKSQVESQLHENFFVPTFGYPGSDNLLLTNNISAEPIFPTGRLAATNAAEVEIYLDKVKAFEANRNLPQTITDRYWMKRILHLGGGDPTIQSSIRTNLENLEQIIENNQFGGDVTAFYKASTDAIEVSRAEQLFKVINEGLSIITFFGHSGANAFDFSLDSPENYQNQDKYPIFLSLGCYSGQIHNDFKGVSEKFVLARDRGGIAFLASTGLGYVSSLRYASENLYRALGASQYGAGIGDAVKQMLHQIDSIPWLGVDELAQQFTLHGDPAIVLNAHEGPDFTIDAASVKFEPGVVDIQADSFLMTFDLVNLGRMVEDSIEVEVIQSLPNGQEVPLWSGKFLTPGAKKQCRLMLPAQGRQSVGLNTIYVTIDKSDLIREVPSPVAEQNNELVLPSGEKGIPLYIIDNSVLPIYPQAFGIVDSLPVTLYASTTNALAPEQTYLVEIDTTAAFDSPLKKSTSITQRGGVVKWTPEMAYQPETVYYWRISPDSTETNVGYQWENSSFTYIPGGGSGWSQGHYWQWRENELEGLRLEEERRKFEYTKEVLDLSLSLRIGEGVWSWNGVNWSDPWKVNSAATFTVVSLSSFDKEDFLLNNPDNPYGSNYQSNLKGYFRYDFTTPESRQGFIKLLEEGIPEGNYVIIYSFQKDENSSFFSELWAEDKQTFGKDISSTLEKYGAKLIRQMEERGSLPYFIIFKKGGKVIEEKIAIDEDDFINAIAPLEYPLEKGKMFSVPIGPSKNWQKINFKLAPSANSLKDSISLKVYGQKSLRSRLEQIREFSISPNGDPLDINFINAVEFPYLVLEWQTINPYEKKPSDLLNWKTLFDPLPDAAINPNQSFIFLKDTLQQGENGIIEFAIENVGPSSLDSLLIGFEIQDNSNLLRSIEKRFDPIKSYDHITASFDFETKEMVGAQKLRINVNPNEDQREAYLFNNFVEKSFWVETDRFNPILDVTFDGIHILNGDIVSASPLISISIQDENQFNRLQDPSLFSIEFVYPDQTRQVLSNTEITSVFQPADKVGKNKATINLNYTFEQDGLYEIKVQAKDANGNLSGVLAYNGTFNVISQNSISNVLPYPNPFSSQTHFVYTLTGEIPTFFDIQILTISGNIVKTIEKEEFGELNIGTHKSQFIWDGTDDFGNKLANGVYLFRVNARDESGKNFELFQNDSTNNYFKNGFGKLVIVR